MDYQMTLNIIRAALDPKSNQADYARQTAERWLMDQPGHLTISVLLAEALLAGDEVPAAARVLREVLQVDPEHPAALELKTRLHELQGEPGLAWAAAAALQQVSPNQAAVKSRLTHMAVQPRPVRIAKKPVKGKKISPDEARPRWGAPPLPKLGFNVASEELTDLLREGEVPRYHEEAAQEEPLD